MSSFQGKTSSSAPIPSPLMSRVLFLSILVVSFAGIARSENELGQTFVRQFCNDCHGNEVQEADIRFDDFGHQPESEAKNTWHKAWRQIHSGEMPPEDSAQPADDQREAVLAWIADRYGPVFDPAAAEHWSLKSPGRPNVPETPWVAFEEVDSLERRPSSDRSSRRRPNPIDRFVAHRLVVNGLSPSPHADRRTLLRRVTLDLTGLLPTTREVDAFVAAKDFGVAYRRTVDRLLASPAYGERWAQHWLDVIRWAETVGFETNAERRNAWHYRDWVIDALNQDLPYDRFVAQQLMGDQLGQDAALGFLVAGPANLPAQIGRDDMAMRQARQDELDEVVRTVSQGLFGLTIGCARCHDHKFDPISQRDYYSLQAVFAGLRYGTRRLRGDLNSQWSRQVPQARKQLQTLQAQLEVERERANLRRPVQEVHADQFASLEADAVRMEIDATNRGPASLYEFEIWSASTATATGQNLALATNDSVVTASSFALANQSRHFDNLVDGSIDRRQAFPWVAADEDPAWLQVDLAQPARIDRVRWHHGSSVPVSYRILAREVDTGTWITVADTLDRLPRFDDRRSANDVSITGQSPQQIGQLLRLIRRVDAAQNQLKRLEVGPQTYAARFVDQPDTTMVLHRGDPMRPKEEAIASPPSVLSPQTPSQNPVDEPERRARLVEHLTQPSHPLTARVLVNRLWQHHFGTGLVETPSDFGRMGRPPSHPDLLDWLAVELVESGWSMKHIHRLIVLSETYQQTSYPRSESLAVDAESRLLWRYPPRRLNAEAIRDSLLQAGGQLNRAMFGRGFDFFNQRGGLADYRPNESFQSDGWRRMVYAHKVRMQQVDVFGAFDCPDAGQMTPQRNQSITPVQALGMLNSTFVNRQASFFAQRLEAAVGDDLPSAVRLAMVRTLSRTPTEYEQAALLELAEGHGLVEACRVIFNTSEFVSIR
ncbi:MAG: DUF1553 domain-containing protein [Planctomycetota bacterium]